MAESRGLHQARQCDNGGRRIEEIRVGAADGFYWLKLFYYITQEYSYLRCRKNSRNGPPTGA